LNSESDSDVDNVPVDLIDDACSDEEEEKEKEDSVQLQMLEAASQVYNQNKGKSVK